MTTESPPAETPWAAIEFLTSSDTIDQRKTNESGVPDLFRAGGRLAPDPQAHGRMLLPRSGPHFFQLFIDPAPPFGTRPGDKAPPLGSVIDSENRETSPA